MDASDWPIWLGIYPLHSTRGHTCRGSCGHEAVGFAAWLARGRVLAVALCEHCCDVAMCASTQRVRTGGRQAVPENTRARPCDPPDRQIREPIANESTTATMQIADTLAATPGIVAALVIDVDTRTPSHDEVFRRSSRSLVTKLSNPESTMQMAAKIFSLEGKSVRVVIGDTDRETLICSTLPVFFQRAGMMGGSDRVCVVSVVSGHPIMKSIERALQRAVRGRRKTPFSAIGKRHTAVADPRRRP